MACEVKFINLDTREFPDAIMALNSDEIDVQRRLYVPDRGECEMEYVSDWMSWHCKSCDHMDMAPRNPKPRYCKWCGRKVVEPTTNDVDGSKLLTTTMNTASFCV